MRPVVFQEANGTLGGGPGAVFGTEDEVVGLPVHRSGDQVISCWRLTWRERFRLILGGHVWLHILTSRTHPPVVVTAESPFEARK